MIKLPTAILVATLCASSSFTFANNKAAGWIADPADQRLIQAPPLEESTSVTELDEAAISNVFYWPASNPNYRWMQMALERNLKGPPSPFKGRGLALLNVAIYDAMLAAEKQKELYKRARPANDNALIDTPETYSYPSSHAAAAGAAAVVLSFLFPEDKGLFDTHAELAAKARVDAGVNYLSDVSAGLEIGNKIANDVIAYAEDDQSDLKFDGTRPTGSDKLKGDVFVYPTAGDWRPMAIASAEKYIPPAPPAIDSEEMKAQLDELMSIDRNVPTSIRAWSNHSTWRAYNWWYEKLATAVFERGGTVDTKEVALAYASVAVANHDAIIACFKAKYTYWLIRPAQLKPELPSLFPNPPHPSYPAAHSCSTMSFAVAISEFFPEHKSELFAAAEEAGYSRMIGGIHYRMDKEAGETIGRGVAEEVLQFIQSL